MTVFCKQCDQIVVVVFEGVRRRQVVWRCPRCNDDERTEEAPNQGHGEAVSRWLER